MTDRDRDDLKRVAQFGLALVGAAMLLGSVMGAAYGIGRDTLGAWTADCLDDC